MGSSARQAGAVAASRDISILLCNCSWEFSTVTGFYFFFFSNKWYFLKLAFWTVSDLKLLLGAG